MAQQFSLERLSSVPLFITASQDVSGEIAIEGLSEYLDQPKDSNAEVDVAAAYGANYGRLQSLKRRFDPDNLFHLNRNIVPAKMG